MERLFSNSLNALHAFLGKLPIFCGLYRSINNKTLRRREFAGCFGIRVILITWLAGLYLVDLSYDPFLKTVSVIFGTVYFIFSVVSYLQMERSETISISGGTNE